MNILLVNKMFKQETMKAVVGKFTGNLIFDFNCFKLLTESLESEKANFLGLLKPKISHVSIREGKLFWIDRLERLLAVDVLPALIRVGLTINTLNDPGAAYLNHHYDFLVRGGVWKTFLTVAMKEQLTNHSGISRLVQARDLFLTLNCVFGEIGIDQMVGLMFDCDACKDGGEHCHFSGERSWAVNKLELAEHSQGLEALPLDQTISTKNASDHSEE